ncbi:MAG TPA: VCBS repeat-containing protein, partial [Chryseolinea sp.]|nr:VCBS repeat-containing protein [Chryseolinea sp.]
MLFPLCVHAQFTYVLEENIPVSDKEGNPLSMPWAGGINAAHYNTMDLDLDGKDDLVLFDRMADKVITFLNRDNHYVPAPQYESSFPTEITNWLLLRDANCDGRKDIFTGDNLGIKVYINVTTGAMPAWKQHIFSAGPGNTGSTVLLSKGFSGKVNVQLQFDDLPAFVDADGDGDLDLFNVRFVGNGTVEYHRNFGMERYGTCDSLDYERQTQTWGGVTECSCGVFAFNGNPCPPATGGRTEHAGGKSLLAFDANGDSKIDLLFSEATCNNLYLLSNSGTLDNPKIATSSSFPPGHPASFLIFPATFYEDLDFDGVKDLLAMPNIFTRTYLQTDLAHSNWFYKNNGTDTAPNFIFEQSDFLQSSMIDVGDNAVPAFIDYDGDGDFDMIVSRHTSSAIAASIALYENVGTAEAPAFKLKNDDMWGFSELSFYNIKIQFADFTNDARLDLVFTATHLQSGFTRLYFVPGTGDGVIDVGGQSIQQTNVAIGINENVYVGDVDRNGLADLLIGRTSGGLEYWRSRADGSLDFDLFDSSFLGLGSSVLRQNLACTISDLDGDGKMDLVLGDQTGTLSIVSNFREAGDASGAVSELVFNKNTETYERYNLGGRLWPTTANLFNSTRPTLVVGNVLGGLSILRNDEGQELPSEPVVHVYPNPVRRVSFTDKELTIRTDRPAFVQAFSTLGQVMTEPQYLLGNE